MSTITDVTSHIRNASFLVWISIRGRTQFKVNDVQAAEEIAEKRNADPKTYAAKKSLIDSANSGLATLVSLQSQVQKLYRDYMTRPYEHGKRMLPVRYIKSAVVTFDRVPSTVGCDKYKLNFPRLYFKPAGKTVKEFEAMIGEPPTTTWWLFQQAMSDAFNLFEKCVDEFIANYDQAVRQAQIDLGDAFDANDYPTKAELKDEYKFEWDRAIPTEEDAKRLEEIFGLTEIQKMIEADRKRMERKITEGNEDVFNCLLDPLMNFVSSIQKRNDHDPDVDQGRTPSIPDSVVGNLKTGVMAARLKNLSEDPALEALCEKIESVLVAYDPKDLKSDELTRDIAKDEAADLLQDVEKLCAGFEGAL